MKTLTIVRIDNKFYLYQDGSLYLIKSKLDTTPINELVLISGKGSVDVIMGLLVPIDITVVDDNANYKLTDIYVNGKRRDEEGGFTILDGYNGYYQNYRVDFKIPDEIYEGVYNEIVHQLTSRYKYGYIFYLMVNNDLNDGCNHIFLLDYFGELYDDYRLTKKGELFLAQGLTNKFDREEYQEHLPDVHDLLRQLKSNKMKPYPSITINDKTMLVELSALIGQHNPLIEINLAKSTNIERFNSTITAVVKELIYKDVEILGKK